jgi:hypothetical protein
MSPLLDVAAPNINPYVSRKRQSELRDRCLARNNAISASHGPVYSCCKLNWAQIREHHRHLKLAKLPLPRQVEHALSVFLL